MEKNISKNTTGERSVTIPISYKYVMPFIITVFGFFVGRVSIFQSINPIAVAFLSLFSFSGKIFYAVSAAVALGFLTVSDSINLTQYLVCIIIMNIVNLSFKNIVEDKLFFIRSLTGAGSIFLSGIIIAFLNAFSLYYTMLAVLQAILSFSLAFVLGKSINLLYHNTQRNIIDNEELLSLSILIGAVVAGSANIYIGDLSVMYFFAALSLMTISYKNGAGLGAGAAVILSVILVISGNMPQEALAVFAISATALGIAKKGGRIVGAFCFCIIGIISALYLNPLFLSKELLVSVGVSCAVFIIIPDRYYFSLTSTEHSSFETSDPYAMRIKDITTHRLNEFSNAFKKISRTFKNLSEKRASLSKDDVAKLIDDVAERTCTKCNMNFFCWENNFYNTYQTFFGILASCEAKGGITEEDIPDEFLKNCVNAEIFAETTNRLFEMYKMNLYWRNKITESRELIGNQLMEVSNIISSLSEEISDETKNCNEMSKRISEELFKREIDFNGVAVTETKDKKTEVIITHPSCYNRNFCVKEIIPVVSETLGKKMFKKNGGCKIDICENKGKRNGEVQSVCKLSLSEEYKFSVTIGSARTVKEGSTKSGDSYTFANLQNGIYIIALSDGMGSGEKAKEESGAAIELFEELTEAGFDKASAANMINSVLVLKSEPDIFSTLDICSINLYTGVCEFTKIGAASAFIKRFELSPSGDKTKKTEKVDVIKSSTLPFGMLNCVDIETTSRNLSGNDMIIMVTDGITDSAGQTLKKDEWLIDFLKECKTKDPQILADKIIARAKQNYGGNAADDMTVVTAMLKQK